MLDVVAIALSGFVLLSLFGIAILMLVPVAQRGMLLPAVPLFGAAFLVVTLHLTGLFVAVRLGVWIAVAVAVGLLAMGLLRHRSARIGGVRAFGWWGLVVVVGAVGAAVALLPSFLVGAPQLVQATSVNDGFYYVSVSQWLVSNPIVQLPSIGTSPLTGIDAPVFGPAFDSISTGLRVGQELVQAGLSTLTGVDPSVGFSAWLGLWVLILPGAAWVFGAAFGCPPLARLALGVVLATSFSLINQVLNQNADSLLGIAFVPLVIGLVAAAVARPTGPAVAPIWLAAGVLSAAIGSYSEYVPLLGVTLACVVLIRPVSDIRYALGRAVAVVGVAIVLAPLIWWRATQSILFIGGLTSNGGQSVPSLREIGQFFIGPFNPSLDVLSNGKGTIIAVWFMLLMVGIGAVLAIVWRQSRGYAIGAVLGGTLIVVFIALRGNPYITSRAVDMLTPLLILAAGLGWWGVVSWVKRATPRIPALVVPALALCAAVAVAATSAGVATRHIIANAESIRTVTADFDEAASWVDELGGDNGEDVTVAVATLFEQLWLSEALHDRADVSYVNLRGDLGYRANLSMESFWDGERDRYVLAGPGAFVAASPGAVLKSNATFSLLDMSKAATVVVPVVSDREWGWQLDAAGNLASYAEAEVEILSGAESLAGLRLAVSGVPRNATVELSEGGHTLVAVTASEGGAQIALDDVKLTGGLATVKITVDGDAKLPFILEGIRHD